MIQKMKKPISIEDYKAYAFGFTMIVALFLAPFAIVSLFQMLIQ